MNTLPFFTEAERIAAAELIDCLARLSQQQFESVDSFCDRLEASARSLREQYGGDRGRQLPNSLDVLGHHVFAFLLATEMLAQAQGANLIRVRVEVLRAAIDQYRASSEERLAEALVQMSQLATAIDQARETTAPTLNEAATEWREVVGDEY